jgi:hypothetical protein
MLIHMKKQGDFRLFRPVASSSEGRPRRDVRAVICSTNFRGCSNDPGITRIVHLRIDENQPDEKRALSRPKGCESTPIGLFARRRGRPRSAAVLVAAFS